MKRIRKSMSIDTPDERYRQGIEVTLSEADRSEFRRRYLVMHDQMHFAGVRPCVDIVLREMRDDAGKGIPETKTWRAG